MELKYLNYKVQTIKIGKKVKLSISVKYKNT